MSNREAAAASAELLKELAHELGPRQTGANTVRCRACGFAWDVGAPAHHAADCLHMRARKMERDLAAASAPQAVRMLTMDEINAVTRAEKSSWQAIHEASGFALTGLLYEHAERAIRKFCEVNGIVPLAPQDSTKEGVK